MSGLYKEGFLFVKICNTSQLTIHAEWNRRWIQLYNNGTLKCYDSCFANHLVFRHDLISLHVSADDLVYPDGVSGKPWIISVGLKERGEKLLLEADCEECMERWAESMTQSLNSNFKNETSAIRRATLPLVKAKPRISPKPMLKANLYSYDTEKEFRNNHSPSPTDTQSLGQEFETGFLISDEIYDDIVNAKSKTNLTLSQYCNFNIPIEPADFSPQKLSKPHATTLEKNSILTGNKNTKKPETTRLQSDDNAVTPRAHSTQPPCHLGHYYSSVDYRSMLQDGNVFLESNIVNPNPGTRHTQSQLTLPISLDKLLNDYWLMCFLIPNGKVYKQMIDLTIPIQTSLQPFLKCFGHSATSPDAYLTIQVIGDLYQTYNAEKSSRTVKKKKKIMSLGWGMSFTRQGVVTSKIVRIKLREDATVKLNADRLNEFLFGMNNLSESELFCMSWVSFVKGNFPVMDKSVSAHHSACIFLIYSEIPGCKIKEVNQFVPSQLKKVISHITLIREEIRTMKSYDTLAISRLFLGNVNTSRSGNAISLPIVKIKKLSFRLKYIDCNFVIGKQHIGITRIENESLPDKLDNFSEFWNFAEIRGWSVISAEDLVFIELAQRVKSTEKTIVFLSPNSEFIDSFFKYLLCLS